MSGFVAPRCRVNVWAVVVEPPVVLVGPTVVVNFQLTTANLTHRTNPETVNKALSPLISKLVILLWTVVCPLSMEMLPTH